MKNIRRTAALFLLCAVFLAAVMPVYAYGFRSGQTPWTDSRLKRYVYCDVSLEDQQVELGESSKRCVVPKSPTHIEAQIRDGRFCIAANPNGETPNADAMILSLGGRLEDGMLQRAQGGGFYFENHLNDAVWIIAAQCGNGYYTRLGEGKPYRLVSTADISSSSVGVSPNQGQIYIPKGFCGYVLYELSDMTERIEEPQVREGMVGLRFGGVSFERGAGSMVWDDFFLWGEEIPDNASQDTAILCNLSLSGAVLGSEFEWGRRNYYALATHDTSKCEVTAEVPAEVSLKINGKETASGKAVPIALAVGQNTVLLTAENARGEKSSVTLRIERAENPDTLYTDLYRPILHFTPYRFSLNDPNGLVYNASTGEYHLYFQCDRPVDSAYAVENNQKSWGHAVSRDLVSWRELEPAILPDDNGTIWSGSCVIDAENVSGFFDENTPKEARMVAFYTYYGGTKPENGLCSVGVAYSEDNGNTFIKPFDSPIIPNTGNMYQPGMRDPKVFWFEDASYENGGIWAMVVAGGRAQLFTSSDLIHWQRDRELCYQDGSPLDSECPDLFPLAADGDGNNIKWIYNGGGVFYLIGELFRAEDGKLDYRAESAPVQPVNGISELFDGSGLFPEMYAAQTFFNDASGRRIEISWMRDRASIFAKPWYSALSLSLEVRLETVNGRLALVKYPVKELETLRTETLFSAENLILSEASENPLEKISASVYDLEAVIDLQNSQGFEMRLRGGKETYIAVRYDAVKNRLYTDKNHAGPYVSGVYEARLKPQNGKIALRIIVDTSVVDVFANNGQVWQNGLTFVNPQNAGLSIASLGGELCVERLTLYGMRSIRSSAPEPVRSPEPAETAPGGEEIPKQASAAWVIAAVAAVISVCGAAVLFAAKKKR